MYPKNAASPERIAVGAVVLIADGTVQTSGVSITVTPQGGASGAGGGTTTYEQGIVCYVPTQAETNYTSFIVTAYKASCIPAAITVVTTASATAGQVRLEGVTHTSAVIPTVTTVGTLTTYTGNTPQTGDAYARLGAPAGASISADLLVIDNFVDGIESTLAAGVTLNTAQPSITFQPITITAGDAIANITFAGTGTADGLAFTRSGAGEPFDANFAAQIQSECNDAIVAYDPATGTEAAAIKSDTAAILIDTAEIGAAGAGLTNINLPNQTMDIVGNITGNLSGSVGSVTGAVGSVTAAVAITSNIKQNQALAGFTFLMTDSTNHNPATGLTVTVTRSIDGAAFGAGTLSAVTEVANGIYSVNFGAGDLNGKTIILQATAAASDTTFERIVTQV